MLLQVHDELVFEVPGPEMDAVNGPGAGRDGRRRRAYRCRWSSTSGVGKNWLETKMG